MDKEYLIKAVRRTIRMESDYISAEHLANIIMQTASLYLADGGLEIRKELIEMLK